LSCLNRNSHKLKNEIIFVNCSLEFVLIFLIMNPSPREWKWREDGREYEENSPNSPKFLTYDPLLSWHLNNRDDKIRRETFNCARRLGKRVPATSFFINPCEQLLFKSTAICTQLLPRSFRRRSRLPSAFKQVCYSNFAKKVPLKHAGERIICYRLELRAWSNFDSL